MEAFEKSVQNKPLEAIVNECGTYSKEGICVHDEGATPYKVLEFDHCSM